MFKVLHIFLLMVLFCDVQHTNAATAKVVKKIVVPAVLRVDSSRIAVRDFSANALHNFSIQREFQYNDKNYAGLSPWERFWHFLWMEILYILSKIFGGTVGSPVFKYVLLGLAVGFLIFVALKIVGIDVVKLLRGEATRIEVPYHESLENIHEISFDEEIERAIQNKNYRLAVRLLYLRSLKQLNDARLIYWQIEKTNSAYINELQDSDQRHFFELLTRQFEYVWYGDFPLDRDIFGRISSSFQDFKQRLS